MNPAAACLWIGFMFAGCQSPGPDPHFRPRLVFTNYEAYAINGIHQNQLGAVGKDVLDSIRGIERRKLALGRPPDLVVEMFSLGRAKGERYGIWLREGAAAKLAGEERSTRELQDVYLLERNRLEVVRSRLPFIEQLESVEDR